MYCLHSGSADGATVSEPEPDPLDPGSESDIMDKGQSRKPRAGERLISG